MVKTQSSSRKTTWRTGCKGESEAGVKIGDHPTVSDMPPTATDPLDEGSELDSLSACWYTLYDRMIAFVSLSRLVVVAQHKKNRY